MFYLKMASQTSDAVEIRVAKISFIVTGTVDIYRISRALIEVLDDDATGGWVTPRYLSNLEAIIHIQRITSPLESD